MLDTIHSTLNAFARLLYEPWYNIGDTLLVGEGNLSFAKSLLEAPCHINQMTATTYETQRNLGEEAKQNACYLERAGINVMHDIDATKLEQIFKGQHFDTIVFQFPNAGSRDAKYRHTANHVLLRKFLRSATECLTENGSILVTTVDNAYYDGVFKMDEAAHFANFQRPFSIPFDPDLFPGYCHTNTNDDDSAIEDYKKFATWIFKPKI